MVNRDKFCDTNTYQCRLPQFLGPSSPLQKYPHNLALFGCWYLRWCGDAEAGIRVLGKAQAPQVGVWCSVRVNNIKGYSNKIHEWERLCKRLLSYLEKSSRERQREEKWHGKRRGLTSTGTTRVIAGSQAQGAEAGALAYKKKIGISVGQWFPWTG